jgi:hypothetical protein
MDGEIICSLEVEPELGCGSEGLGKKPGRLERDAALASDDLVDALHWDADVRCKSDLSLAQRKEELLTEDLSGMRRDTIGGLHA